MRVGALPQFPSNALNYNLTWTTDGVINEYCEPCEAIVDGRLRECRRSRSWRNSRSTASDYEAFNTSGGLGTLCETLAGKVRSSTTAPSAIPGMRHHEGAAERSAAAATGASC